MGILGSLLSGIVSVALLAAVVGGVAWYFDYGVQADVTGTQCHAPVGFGSDPGTSVISVKTKVGGITHDVTGVDGRTCLTVAKGNYVVYHLKSGRTSLYDSQGGTCIYDSVGGIGGCKAAA